MQIISRFLLGGLFALLFLVSCKKDKANPEEVNAKELEADAAFNNSITPGIGNVFIEEELLPGQKSQLFAKLAYKGDSILFFGATNNQAQANSLHTIVIAKGNAEYIVTEYLTNSLTIMYRITNGVKSRLVIKTYVSAENEKQVIFLDYDWKNNKSKVIYSSFIVDNKAVDTKSSKSKHSVLIDGKICAEPAPTGSDEMDNYLKEKLQFVACHGTHPINQPILALQDKIKSLPDFADLMGDFEALKQAGSFFESAFGSIKNAITNYKFKSSKAGRFYNWLQDLVDEYIDANTSDVRLTLIPTESDLEFNEGIDEYLKVTCLLTELSTNAPYIKTPVLTEMRIGKPAEPAMYAEISQTSTVDGKVTFFIKPEDISDLGASATLQAFYGFKGLKTSETFNLTFDWQRPHLSVSSGNNQIANPGMKLQEPLKIRVLDQNNKPFKNWPVSWKVLNGGGTITFESKTDDQGFAKADWTLGTLGTQEVEASVKKKDGSLAQGAPVVFKAGTANYVLELQDNNPDYSKMKAIKEIKRGDSFTTPNGLSQYFKLKLNGVYVKSSDAAGAPHMVFREFFHLPNYPVQATDHTIKDYPIEVHDPERGTNSTVLINLTLSNEIYRKVVGSSIRIVPPAYAGGENSAVSMQFNSNGTCTETSKSGDVTTQKYNMFTAPNTSSAYWFIQCSSGGISKESIGYIDMGRPASAAIPGRFIIVYSDGSLSLNVMYPCPGTSENERVTVSWQ